MHVLYIACACVGFVNEQLYVYSELGRSYLLYRSLAKEHTEAC
jgi:hypothetical protein